MLRLSRVDAEGTLIVLAEGKLLAPWIGEVRDALRAPGRQRRLDLGAVTYVDAEGARLLHALRRDGVEIVRASAFVEQLLRSSAR